MLVQTLSTELPASALADFAPKTQKVFLASQTPVSGWLEAFAAHPRIGDVDGLRKKFGAFAAFSQGEQAAASASATDDTLQASDLVEHLSAAELLNIRHVTIRRNISDLCSCVLED